MEPSGLCLQHQLSKTNANFNRKRRGLQKLCGISKDICEGRTRASCALRENKPGAEDSPTAGTQWWGRTAQCLSTAGRARSCQQAPSTGSDRTGENAATWA